jgi:hypothetical protein
MSRELVVRCDFEMILRVRWQTEIPLSEADRRNLRGPRTETERYCNERRSNAVKKKMLAEGREFRISNPPVA